MSIHRSLKSANTMKRHRSVLSRLERVKTLQEKGDLDPLSGTVLGMPKVKHLKMRIRKEKAAAAAEGAEGAAAPAAADSAAAAKPGAPAAKAEGAKPKK